MLTLPTAFNGLVDSRRYDLETPIDETKKVSSANSSFIGKGEKITLVHDGQVTIVPVVDGDVTYNAVLGTVERDGRNVLKEISMLEFFQDDALIAGRANAMSIADLKAAIAQHTGIIASNSDEETISKRRYDGSLITKKKDGTAVTRPALTWF